VVSRLHVFLLKLLDLIAQVRVSLLHGWSLSLAVGSLSRAAGGGADNAHRKHAKRYFTHVDR
jgi:hypothetical protein